MLNVVHTDVLQYPVVFGLQFWPPLWSAEACAEQGRAVMLGPFDSMPGWQAEVTGSRAKQASKLVLVVSEEGLERCLPVSTISHLGPWQAT
jgi:hypothetical protein